MAWFNDGILTVQKNPHHYGLFSPTQYEANRIAGQQDVIASPMAYGLYTATSFMDLRMGGLMIQKQGTDATIVFQPQTTTDLVTLPFTNNGPPVTNAIPMPGDKGFVRVGAIYVPANDLTDVRPASLAPIAIAEVCCHCGRVFGPLRLNAGAWPKPPVRVRRPGLIGAASLRFSLR